MKRKNLKLFRDHKLFKKNRSMKYIVDNGYPEDMKNSRRAKIAAWFCIVPGIIVLSLSFFIVSVCNFKENYPGILVFLLFSGVCFYIGYKYLKQANMLRKNTKKSRFRKT